MVSVHLRGLRHAHTLAAGVLDDVTLDLAAPEPAEPRPFVGVVGPNGAGKSTLLRLLAGELTPIGGTLEVQATGPVRLVRQDVDELTDDVRGFAWQWDGVAVRLRRRLHLDPDDLDSRVGRGWGALSPGQRKRWQVAAALAEQPDVLLLDEPTNHLDAAARDLLVGVLQRFGGLGLLASHDRAVLERLTSRTLRVHRGRVELHAGSHGEAAPRWRAAEQAERDAHERARRELRREQRLLGDVRRDRHGAEVGPRRERRLAGANQPDAREATQVRAAQGRAGTGAAGHPDARARGAGRGRRGVVRRAARAGRGARVPPRRLGPAGAGRGAGGRPARRW
ncbi:ATP-binding cassette domain-containing protein [Egicoccus halophilus]|uniref:ABC transporter domain-containing protein n=1 Tax=Egicoccus halophilus TaxID=1670830 RepID=A0A8J3AB12_9ACTN|nr:ATP-binding cassette domain-containing protein [Egicoccus halophilus]GGI09120.1 hypothetical protein GCM10011354_32500 [Egicoccus halophilus]